jgi:hypothetical protein
MAMTGRYMLSLEEIDKTQVAQAGGKGRTWGSFRGSKAFACRLAFA